MSTLKIKRENGKIFCPLADSWHIETPEEKVRQEYIKILVENYGYSLDQMAQEIKVNNSQRGQGKARADIVIWKSKQDKIESKAAFIVVECKAENVRIREEDYYQGYNYASWAGASFFVTTNEKETKYFNVDKDYLPKELVEVVAIPTAEEALNDKKVKDILSKTKTFTRDDFTKILRTCHNIIRNNDKLSPEAAFDEISKILFMKIKYAFEYMREKIEEDVKKAKSELRSVIEGENYDSLSEKEQVVINERIEAMQSTLNKELDTQVEGSRMYNLSRNCIYGTDANPRMARTSKIVEEKSKKLKVKALIAAAEKELRDLEKAIIEEAKPLTKEYFHYEIPIAMVEDAGITSTGAVSAGNQLPTLQDEYKEYRIAKKLWNEANSVVSYTINSQGRLFRTSDGKEVELKW